MKKNNWILLALLMIYGCSTIVFVFYAEKQRMREMALSEKVKELENSLYATMLIQMESSLLSRAIVPVEGMRKGNFVLVFPDDVCDICNKWIFNQLRDNEDLERIKVVVPPRMKKTMQVYNEVYDLHLFDMLYSDELKLSEDSDNSLYIFYYSSKGEVLFPLLLKEKSFKLKTYMDIVFTLVNDSLENI